VFKGGPIKTVGRHNVNSRFRYPQPLEALDHPPRVLAATMRCLLLSLVLAVFLAPAPLHGASTFPDEPPVDRSAEISPWQDLGWGMGSVLATVFYSPVKIVYAGVGMITSGLGYVLSAGNTHVATNILDPAIGGDYILTPSHLKGEKKLAFMGARRYP